MKSSRADRLAEVLDEFLGDAPEIQAAAVVSVDGLPMASALPPDVEEDRLAAMSAALHTLGERAASGLGKGDLAQVFVEAEDGYVVLMAAGEGAVLVTVADREAKAGLVIFEMRKTATRVAEIMNGESGAVSDRESGAVSDRESGAVSDRESGAVSDRERRPETPLRGIPQDEAFERARSFDDQTAAPVLDPFATPTEPFLSPPPPPPDSDEDDHAISSWH